MNTVCHVVPSSSGSCIVLGAFEREVEVWDVRTRLQMAVFTTVSDFGGSRLALSDERNVLVAAAYTRHGIAGYSPLSGEELWRRRDLKQIQELALSADGSRVFCGREGAPCEVVDVDTGETVDRVRGSRAVLESPWNRVRLNDRRHPLIESTNGPTRVQIVRETFAIIHAAFAPHRLLISESGGPLRCLDDGTGEEAWRYDPGRGAHVLRVAYRPADESIVAIERTLESHDPYRLVSMSLANGEVGTCTEVDGIAHGFCEQGGTLITSARQVISTRSRKTVGHLASAGNTAGSRQRRVSE